VEYQLEKCGTVLEAAQLQSLEKQDYAVHAGRFGDLYAKMGALPFILRADFLLDRVADFIDALDGSPALSDVLLDFGCGRVLAGLETLSNADWGRLCEVIDQHDGHGLLMKAPDDFRKENDVFGAPRPEWKVMHRIKAAMDPTGVFAPGCLPGKV
jgi:FAD/FMN-containing dehydrogenase